MKKYPKNLIFLDFDGCVTSKNDGTYFNSDPAKYQPSSKILDLLLLFCKETSSKIVISSNWRKFDIDGEWKTNCYVFKNPLANLIKKLGKYYFGTLPIVRHIRKAEATILWFEENCEFKGNFVIFDDDLIENYHTTHDYNINKHFIFIDNTYGITESNLIKAKEILNEK